METQHETGQTEASGTMLKVRIGADLHQEIVKRSEASGRAKSTEMVRLATAGLFQQQTLGARAENGFELTLAYALHGEAGVIDVLIKKLGVEPMRLRSLVAQAEYGKRFDAMSPEDQQKALYGIKS